jgi:hypothetical protein
LGLCRPAEPEKDEASQLGDRLVRDGVLLPSLPTGVHRGPLHQIVELPWPDSPAHECCGSRIERGDDPGEQLHGDVSVHPWLNAALVNGLRAPFKLRAIDRATAHPASGWPAPPGRARRSEKEEPRRDHFFLFFSSRL